MPRFSCSCPRWGYTDKQALQVPEQKLAVCCPFLLAAQPRCRSSSSLRSRAPWRCDGAIVRSPTLAWRYAAHARYPPAGRRARLRVGYVRAAPPTAEGWLTHAQCSSRLRGLLSAPLRAERERRAAHALAGSGFSRPVGFPPRPEVTVGRCVVAPQSSAHLRSSFHGSKTLMAGQ